MKKILFILISITLFFLGSCTGEEKDIYDGNSNERLTEEEKACREDLQEAENGWIMEYFPNASQYGGYQLLVSFDEDGMATFSAEKAVSGDNTRKESGMYTLKHENGILLSFDTYNRIFHQFSDPQSDGIGFGGDYEFYVMEHTSDHIVLKGKKIYQRVELHRLSTDVSWSEYLSKIDKMATLVDTKYLDMTLNGKPVSMLAKSSFARCFNLSYTTDEAVETHVMSFVLTVEGVQCAQPVTIGGVTVDHFIWDDTTQKLVYKDDENTIEIGTLSINRIFNQTTDTWYFANKRSSTRFRQLWNSMVYIMNSDFNTEFNDFYLGLYANPFEPEENYQAVLAVCRDNIGSVYTTQYEIVEGTTDHIRILWKGYAMSAQYYYKAYEPLLTFLSKEGENEFIIEADNNIYPQELKFTKVSNPNHWFIISTKQEAH